MDFANDPRRPLELAAWDPQGEKLWSTFVEPPWDYRVTGDRVQLDVIGRKSDFELAQGRRCVNYRPSSNPVASRPAGQSG
jgi:hypothetical protein